MGNIASEIWSSLPAICATHVATVKDAGEVITACEIYFYYCSGPRQSYRIDCGSTGGAACTCKADGQVVSIFQPMEAVCPFALDPDGGVAAMNYACGFNVALPESGP